MVVRMYRAKFSPRALPDACISNEGTGRPDRRGRMSAFTIGLIAFVCIFGGALAGLVLRAALPEQQLSEDSKDIVKVVTGLIATVSALVLGLLIASAKSTFDDVNAQFKQVAAKVIVVDRALAQYGPAAKDARDLLRSAYAAHVEQLFSADGTAASALRDTLSLAQVDAKVRALVPADDSQRALKKSAERVVAEVAQVRWLGFEEAGTSIPPAFLTVLVPWLAAMCVGFGLFSPRNATALIALLIGALVLSTSIFLIEEMGRPLSGVISISSEPMRNALAVLSTP